MDDDSMQCIHDTAASSCCRSCVFLRSFLCFSFLLCLQCFSAFVPLLFDLGKLFCAGLLDLGRLFCARLLHLFRQAVEGLLCSIAHSLAFRTCCTALELVVALKRFDRNCGNMLALFLSH